MKELITKFYESFANLDAETMAECYHTDVVFEDPAFGKLEKEKVGNMWRMLCDSQRGKGMHISFGGVEATENTGKANWQAVYTFSKTGRYVNNKITAYFEFKDGLIIKHTDVFNLYRWSQQALGIPGYIIGWTPSFKTKLNAQTNSMLEKWESKNNKKDS